MRRAIRRLIPRMFHRRLLLLAAPGIVVLLLYALQMTWLTIVHGAQLRAQAESVFFTRELIPTRRGTITDARGRVLATDRASHEVAVHYALLSGQWPYTQARRAARLAYDGDWAALFDKQKRHQIAMYEPRFEHQIDDLWITLADLGGIDAAELYHRKQTIRRRVQHIRGAVWRRRLADAPDDEPVDWGQIAIPVAEQHAYHPLLSRLDERSLTRIRHRIAAASEGDGHTVWSQVCIRPARHREYPLRQMRVIVDTSAMPSPLRRDEPVAVTMDGVAIHLLGKLRQVDAAMVAARPFRDRGDPKAQPAKHALGGYLPGDRAGAWGLERAQERVLRGARGEVDRHLQTRTKRRIEPVAGSNIQLTIDMHLQARIQALMDPFALVDGVPTGVGLTRSQPWHVKEPTHKPGTPLCGAAIVLNVETARILAAVSVPTFTISQLDEDPDSVWSDHLNQPFVNRAFAGVYQPGSIAKPLVLNAAIVESGYTLGQTIECTGYLIPPGNIDQFRCWIFKQNPLGGSTHGAIDANGAIARSCNLFFYTLGRRLGAPGVNQWYARFGVGRPVDVGLSLRRVGQARAQGTHEAILLGIGQGPVSWSPLQAANAYATLARGGLWISPTMIDGPGSVNRQQRIDLGLDPLGLAVTLAGLHDAVNQRYGTGHHITLLDGEAVFNMDDVDILGKTGTATVRPLREPIDDDGDGKRDRWGDVIRHGDHAWFVGLVAPAGAPRPTHAIAVIVEHAGSGGAAAGPIANQILYAMRAEGYL